MSEPEFAELQNCRITCMALTNPEFERITEWAALQHKKQHAGRAVGPKRW
jgi:hypothetical protein